MAYLVPVIAKAYEELTGSLDPVLSTVAELGKTVHIWGVAIPAVFVFAMAWWWYRTGRLMRTVDSGAEARQRRFLFGWHRPGRFPTIRQALIDGRMATFAEVLGLLDEHEVPLPEAIVLAADASGDRGLSGAVRYDCSTAGEGRDIFSSRGSSPCVSAVVGLVDSVRDGACRAAAHLGHVVGNVSAAGVASRALGSRLYADHFHGLHWRQRRADTSVGRFPALRQPAVSLGRTVDTN